TTHHVQMFLAKREQSALLQLSACAARSSRRLIGYSISMISISGFKRKGVCARNRPPNVPQRYAIQAMPARTFLLSGFVSIENKGSRLQLPKLVIRVRFPVARSIFP